MCFALLRYGRIVCMNIDKNSFLDFRTDDDAAKKWGAVPHPMVSPFHDPPPGPACHDFRLTGLLTASYAH